MLTPILSWYEGHNFTSLGKILKCSKLYCTKHMESSEGRTSSTHSFAYSYRLVKKCFMKFCEISKCHNFLIFQPIFIRFSLFCSKLFTLSSEIKWNLFRISPLMVKSCPSEPAVFWQKGVCVRISDLFFLHLGGYRSRNFHLANSQKSLSFRFWDTRAYLLNFWQFCCFCVGKRAYV